MTFADHTPIPRSFPAPAGEVARPQAVTEGASSLLPRASGGGAEQSEAEGVSSSCLPRPAGEGGTRSVTDGVFISPSGCHGLLRRATRALSGRWDTDITDTQVMRRARVVRLRRSNPWHPEQTATLPSPRGVAWETSPAQATRANRFTTLSLFAFFGVFTFLLSGCCHDRSLIKHNMSDEQVFRIATKQFEGNTSLNKRFQTAARMVDWNGVYPNNYETSYIPAVYWESDTEQMRIPVYRCLYGHKFPQGDAVFQFDSDGGLIDARLDQRSYKPLPYDSFDRAGEEFDDPWGKPETLTHTLWLSLRSDDMQPASASIRLPRSDREEISRVVKIRYRTTSNRSSLLSGGLTIHTEPMVDFVVLDEQGPVIRTNPLYNAYIVQEDDFAERSGSWRPQSTRDKPFPEFEAHFQSKILLAPHEGVTLTVGIDESEATP